MTEKEHEDKKVHEEVDLYRDTNIRYAGYANELGESFKAVISKAMYRLSYAVSITYVVADAIDKYTKANNLVEKDCDTPAEHISADGIKAGLDTLAWQGLASVAVPGFTINRAVWVTGKVADIRSLQRVTNPSLRKWAPICVGLGLIPFIVSPIDEGVTFFMDSTIRQYY